MICTSITVEWRATSSAGLFPDVAFEHLARHDLALVAEEVFQHVDLARRQRGSPGRAQGDAGARCRAADRRIADAAVVQSGRRSSARHRARVLRTQRASAGSRPRRCRARPTRSLRVLRAVSISTGYARRAAADAAGSRYHREPAASNRAPEVEGAPVQDVIASSPVEAPRPARFEPPAFGDGIAGFLFVLDDKDARGRGRFKRTMAS